MPVASPDTEMLRGLQERAARALPAEYVECVKGWWLRHAPGCSWWVGTVLPHGDSVDVDLLARSERFYSKRGVRPRFQIGPPACSPNLDAVLAERGYRVESPMSLLIASSDQVWQESTNSGQSEVWVEEIPNQSWFDGWVAVHGHAGEVRAEWDLLGRVEQPSAYASARTSRKTAAVGRAVADGGWVGVFGMGTLSEERGKGYARAVLGALARWAVSRDAAWMYLQVEQANSPAIGLYQSVGFTELANYHYRSLAARC